MYSKIKNPVDNSKKVVFLSILAVGFALLLIPQIQNSLILRLERFLSKDSTWSDNFNRLAVLGLSGCLILILFFLDLVQGFFKKISSLSGRSTLFRLFLIVTPVIFGFMIVTYGGVNVLYMDDWLLPNFIDDVLTNGISLDALRAKHVVHLKLDPQFIGTYYYNHEVEKVEEGRGKGMVTEEQENIAKKVLDAAFDLHTAQIFQFMKLSGISLGFLFNFNVRSLKNGIKRMVLNAKSGGI